MTGYRLGYVAAPARLVSVVTTLQSQITSCAGALSQAAGVAAPTLVPDKILDENVMRVGQHLDKSRFACRTRKNGPSFLEPTATPSNKGPSKTARLVHESAIVPEVSDIQYQDQQDSVPQEKLPLAQDRAPVDIPAASAASRLPHYWIFHGPH
jgi:hypothetical protein